MMIRVSPTRRHQPGFTFLELMLVVSILSGIAVLAFATAGDTEEQRRYEETQRRLEAIRRAVLGTSEPAWDGQVRLSGYLADNGVLPTDTTPAGRLVDLLSQPPGYAGQGLVTPVFDPVPTAATCLNDGGESTVTWGDGEKLVKGWGGPYLRPAPGSAVFRDGWGNHATGGDDASNFGWIVGTDAHSLTVTSYARDNAIGGSDYDADLALALATGSSVWAGNWRVDLSGWTVTVRNTTAAAVNHLRVSVLAFANDAGGGKWKRITSSEIVTLAAGATDTVSFNAYCNNGSGGGDSRVAQGRHLIVLVSDADGSAHSSDDAVLDRDRAMSAVQAWQAAFFAGIDRPALTLEIR